MSLRQLPCILIMMILLQACNQASEQLPEHLRAEPLIDSSPDSALILLAGIDSSHLDKPFHRANHAVLTVLARYRAGIDDTSISLLEPAIDFYARDSRPCRYAMLTHFLKGNILYNNKHYSEAIIEFMDAENLADKLNDFRYLGLARRNISDIYNHVFCIPQQLEYAQKALEAFNMYADSGYTAWAYADVASAFINIDSADKALIFADSALNISHRIHDTASIAAALRAKAYGYLQKEYYKKALIQFASLYQADSTHWSDIDSRLFCQTVYYSADSATITPLMSHILTHASETSTGYSYAYALKGDYKKAYSCMSLQHADLQLMFEANKKQTISTIFIKRLEDEMEHVKLTLNHEKSRGQIYLAIIITLIVATAISWHLISKLKKQRQKLFIEKARETNKEIVQSLSSQELLSESSHSSNALTEVIDSLCLEYYESVSDHRKQQIAKSIKSNIANFKDPTSSQFQELASIADRNTGGILIDFFKSYAAITVKEKQFIVYSLIGLSTTSISVLLDEVIGTTYNRRSKTKKKLAALSPVGVEISSKI